MDFSIMFWGNIQDRAERDPYRLLLETAKYADQNGYSALWVPERHFHTWGGLYPNPSVLCAALAAVTKRVRLRAGSVVVPLHHPVRIAEEWAVVDNLSNGRVELSIASGWREDDFVLAPEAYPDRKDAMFTSLEILQKLWRGEPYAGKTSDGRVVSAATYPRPVQAELPLWVTSAGSLRTISDAGGGGFGLLTHLLGQSFEDLEKKIAQYNAYRAGAGLSGKGKVALMLHTFLGSDLERVKALVREPMLGYLHNSAELGITAEQRTQWDSLDPSLKAQRMEHAFERYFENGLMGTAKSCRAVVERARAMGVTDICCLVDFGLPTDDVLEGLPFLTALKDSFG